MKLTTEKKCMLLFIIALFLFYMIKNKETIVDGMSNYMELKNADDLIASNKKKKQPLPILKLDELLQEFFL